MQGNGKEEWISTYAVSLDASVNFYPSNFHRVTRQQLGVFYYRASKPAGWSHLALMRSLINLIEGRNVENSEKIHLIKYRK